MKDLTDWTPADPHARIYASERPRDASSLVGQIRHLSLIGLAAGQTTLELRNLDAAFGTLFEVIHQLSDALEDHLDEAQNRPPN